jgi:hypothetical protein
VEKSYKDYAWAAKRLLIDEKAPAITLTACGLSIINLMKVSSIMCEMIPELHRLSSIKYADCRTCASKMKKQKEEDYKAQLKHKTLEYLSSVRPGERAAYKKSSMAHKCKVAESFPMLIIYQQTLSVKEELIKSLPNYKEE